MGISGTIQIFHRPTELPKAVRSPIKGGVIFAEKVPPRSLIEGVIVRDHVNCWFNGEAQP